MHLQVADALHDFFGTTTAPDCSVECVGVHYTKSWRHKLELLAGVRLSSGAVLECMQEGRAAPHTLS